MTQWPSGWRDPQPLSPQAAGDPVRAYCGAFIRRSYSICGVRAAAESGLLGKIVPIPILHGMNGPSFNRGDQPYHSILQLRCAWAACLMGGSNCGYLYRNLIVEIGGYLHAGRSSTDSNSAWTPWQQFFDTEQFVDTGIQLFTVAPLSDGRLKLWGIDGNWALFSTWKLSQDPSSDWARWSSFPGP
jgi:hypothetical protein